MATQEIRLKDSAGNVLHPETEVSLVVGLDQKLQDLGTGLDAMRFRGTVGTGGTVTTLPASGMVGDAYKVSTAGTYAGNKCEVGDMLIRTGTGNANTDWAVLQANIDGAVTSATTLTADRLLAGNGGQSAKLYAGTVGSTTQPVYLNGGVPTVIGYTIQKSVPSNALFTDTTYGILSDTFSDAKGGVMSKDDYLKLMTAAGVTQNAIGVEVWPFNDVDESTSVTVEKTSTSATNGRFVYCPNVTSLGLAAPAGRTTNGAVFYKVGTQYYLPHSAGTTTLPGLSELPATFSSSGTAIILVQYSNLGASATPTGRVYGKAQSGKLIMISDVPKAYTLPTAAANTLGGIEVGFTRNAAARNYPVTLSGNDALVNVDEASSSAYGVVKVGYAQNARNYPVQLSSGQMYVNVPWTDTHYTLPVAAAATLGGVKIGYATNASTCNYGVQLSNQQMFVNIPLSSTTANGLMSATQAKQLNALGGVANLDYEIIS